ncbi:hypothetical protein B0H14DRAFT_3854405 [Mycena olivaceomarginata]|nr:hypothetical protein B0H14DRAFT_3854405 [Mycena olivaceomarginata]
MPRKAQAEDNTIETMESYHSQVNEWKDKLDDFFAENASTINSAENVLSVVLDPKNIEAKFTALEQTSKTIMAGLDILGQIHPFISRECQSLALCIVSESVPVAAQAFKLALNIDATRRENDKKVLALQLQIQDTIVVLFHLRRIGDPKKKVKGLTVEGRLRGLVQSIAEHVTSCRSACKEYKNKRFIPKMIKCKIYEDRLATYAQLFADDKREMQSSLGLYTAGVVDEISQKIDQQGAISLRGMAGRRTALKTMRLCDSSLRWTEKTSRRGQGLENARTLLQKELAEDVDEALEKHIGALSDQLEKLNDRVLSAMISSKEEILAAFHDGPHKKILDLELRKIWREQRWPGSVNGQDFISALNEYYEEKLVKSGDSVGQAGIRSLHDGERWALGFINTANSKLIIEAVDDDGSGSVSIREVNNFTVQKPNGWSLANWIAFWAVGWYPTVAWYKENIISILSESTSLSQYVPPRQSAGRQEVFFRSGDPPRRLLLRSTHSPTRKIHFEPRLKILTEDFRRLEEELLKTKLEERSYFLDQPATVQRVSGHRRIDRYIFPLLYLLLNHHRDTIRRAGRGPLDDSEFTSMSTSLDTIFKAAKWRLDELEAIFQMNSLDVKERLGHFSFGMFQLLYDLEDDEDGVEIDSAQGTKDEHENTTDAITAVAVGSAPTVALTPLEVPKDRQEKIEPRKPAYERLDFSNDVSTTNSVGDALTTTEDQQEKIEAQDLAYERLNTFLLDNASTISHAGDALRAVLNSDVKSITSKIAGIVESSNVLIQGLDQLGELYPFVKVAVLAFKVAMKINNARRDQNNKVLAVMIEMQDMMTTLFQLRHVRDSENTGYDGATLEGRLRPIIVSITEDIKSCINMCDVYMKKQTFAKIFKAKIFDAHFADYVTRFSKYKQQLMFALSIRTAIATDVIEVTVETIQLQIEENELSLQKLVTQGGENLARLNASSAPNEDLASAKNLLTKELAENMDKAFEKNFDLFSKKIEMQAQQQQEERATIRALSMGPHDRISDPDLAALWKHQGWKSSVNGGKFVLALNDHYYTNGAGVTSTDVEAAHDSASLPVDSLSIYEQRHWELAYINGAHLRRILEVIDDEGTGFISLRNANGFAASPRRPKGWNWVAFWAAGWHASVTWYKNRIYHLLSAMMQHIPRLKTDNVPSADAYFAGSSISRVELLLRSTRSANGKVYNDAPLARASTEFQEAEEQRLEINLDKLSYELDDVTTIELIKGSNRIEHYLYPLLYLLLRRHFDIIRLAYEHILHESEWDTMTVSLETIFQAVDERAKNLEASFDDNLLDVKQRLGHFAFGMFQLRYTDHEREPNHFSRNSIALFKTEDGYDWADEDLGPYPDDDEDTIKATLSQINMYILRYPLQN